MKSPRHSGVGRNPVPLSKFFKIHDSRPDPKTIVSEQYPQKAKRPPYSYLDKTKIETALGIKIRTWQKMLTDYLNKK